MQTKLIPLYQDHPSGARAEEILRSCVHCGFCNATCPTYQVLGDELDGPRGRIYQIKQLLEGGDVDQDTRKHLDRCLTCRSCETTCPSGVQYHALLDIGKQLIAEKLPRPKFQQFMRSVVHAWLSRPALFAFSMKLARAFRFVLPKGLKSKVVARDRIEVPSDLMQSENSQPTVLSRSSVAVGRSDAGGDGRSDDCNARRRDVSSDVSGDVSGDVSRDVVYVFGACIQDALTPEIDRATMTVFKILGFDVRVLNEASCCGALSQHTDQQAKAKQKAMANIDAWLSVLESAMHASGSACIVANASGCGVFIKDYPELFELNDPYFDKAKRLSAMCKDPVELFDAQVRASLRACLAGAAPNNDSGLNLAYHPPCTLQHGQGLDGAVEDLFSALGVSLLLPKDKHLCCGSAGTYSLLEPKLSGELKNRKLDNLAQLKPHLILSANIGCQSHLASESEVPVVHWLQYLAHLLTNQTTL